MASNHASHAPCLPNFYCIKCHILTSQELLKYTDETHPDHSHIVAAQKAMKDVAMLINEQKRRIENMGKIGCWQRTIEGWKVNNMDEIKTCHDTVIATFRVQIYLKLAQN